MSEQTVDSLSTADKEVWRSIRKELEDLGLSLAAFDANKDFIFSWLMKAIADGALEEQAEDMDEVGSSSDSESSGSASTTRPELPDQEASEALRLETTSSSSPVDSTRSAVGERSGSHLPRLPFSSPMQSSESLVQPPVQPPEILDEINKWRLWRKGTQPQTDAEQVYEVGEADAQYSSALAFQTEQGHPGAKSTPLSPMHSLESLHQRPESMGKRGPQARRNVKQIYELEGDYPHRPLVQTSQTGQGTSSASSTSFDNEVEPSPSPYTRLADTKALLNAQKARYPSQKLKAHTNKRLGWVTSKEPGQDIICLMKQGDYTEVLKMLRSQSRRESWANKTTYRALSLAVQQGFPELLEPLLDAGQVGINDLDLLTIAVEYSRQGRGGAITLQQMLSLGADPSLFGSNCVLRAIMTNDQYALRVFLNAGVDVNARVGVSRSIILLHRAISTDASDTMVRMILDSGAAVNWTDPAGQTPLGVAIAKRRFDCVNILISYGADLEKPTLLPSTKQRVSPLIGAAVIDESRIVKLLLDKGADINKHWSSLQVLDLFSSIRRRSLSGPIVDMCKKWLNLGPASAVHAAVTYDLDATGMLKMLIQDGAQTDWNIALILAFLEREHYHIGKVRRWDNSQGALVAVLTKCSESRGISRDFRSTDSQVFDVMAACIASTNEIQPSDDESLRSLVDEVISRCH